MTTFEKREEGYEAAFAHDEELRFRAMARRNKLLGMWAAEHLGMDAERSEDYAREVVRADFSEPGEEDVYRKIHADFAENNVDVSEHRIRRKMSELMAKALQQIAAGE